MDERFRHLDQYLGNTERMVLALKAADLDTVDDCLNRNAKIMADYSRTIANTSDPLIRKALREKIKAVMDANRECFLLAEKKCRALKSEIEETSKNRLGIIKYGGTHVVTPRFIDNKL